MYLPFFFRREAEDDEDDDDDEEESEDEKGKGRLSAKSPPHRWTEWEMLICICKI